MGSGDHATIRRSWLEEVLHSVRALGDADDLDATLRSIAEAVTEVLGFRAAVVNVVEGDQVRVAVAVGADELLGGTAPLAAWRETLGRCRAVGSLRHLPAEREAEIDARIPYLTPDLPVPAADDVGAWHPYDLLLAPMHGQDGELVGVLCVDEPLDGRFPDEERCTVLELFASQAGAAIAEARQRADLEDREHVYREAFRSGPTPMAVVDARLRVVAANDVANAWLPPGSFDRGAELLALVDPLDRDDLEAAASAALGGAKGRVTVEHRLAVDAGRWARTELGAVAGHGGTRLVLSMVEVDERG